jgi:hypothetical protein
MSLGRAAAYLVVSIVVTRVSLPCLGTPSNSAPGDPLRSNGNVSRTLITYKEIFSDENVQSPVHDSAFALPQNASMPSEKFEGRLELLNTANSGGFALVHKEFEYSGDLSSWMHLPAFSFEFLQNGSHLIPVKQGLIFTGSPAWNYIIGPGRVWKENSDSGYSRASFPFALVERNQNCVHNGQMMFLFSNKKSPRISRLRYQVTQETCRYLKFDLWGQVAAAYSYYRVANNKQLKKEHAGEVSARVPYKPFAALVKDFPNSGVDLTGFLRTVKFPKDITTYGLYIDGVHYVGNCQTRYGEYAFCDQIRLPSYSTAKSAFASVAMMRLGELYGSGVYRQLIRDFVPQYTLGGDWSKVTFENTLDMATGNYIKSGFEADEDGPEEVAFLMAEPYDKKIAAAFTPFPHQADPGTTWIYQSSATFIVTQAMTGFLDKQRGAAADLFALVRDDVYKPIQVSKGGLTTIRTDNAETGHPSGYFGLFYIPDDVVKIARFLNLDQGRIHSKQILDPERLDESLFRKTSVLGLPVPDVGNVSTKGTFHYNHAFWAKHITAAEFPQYTCDFWIPFMSGYGGITILLLPNGVNYYVFSDANEFNWYDAVHQINKLKPFCHGKPSSN